MSLFKALSARLINRKNHTPKSGLVGAIRFENEDTYFMATNYNNGIWDVLSPCGVGQEVPNNFMFAVESKGGMKVFDPRTNKLRFAVRYVLTDIETGDPTCYAVTTTQADDVIVIDLSKSEPVTVIDFHSEEFDDIVEFEQQLALSA